MNTKSATNPTPVNAATLSPVISPSALDPKQMLAAANTAAPLKPRGVLEEYKESVHALRMKGMSYSEVAQFFTDRGVPCSQGTVINFMRKYPLPEVKADNAGRGPIQAG